MPWRTTHYVYYSPRVHNPTAPQHHRITSPRTREHAPPSAARPQLGPARVEPAVGHHPKHAYFLGLSGKATRTGKRHTHTHTHTKTPPHQSLLFSNFLLFVFPFFSLPLQSVFSCFSSSFSLHPLSIFQPQLHTIHNNKNNPVAAFFSLSVALLFHPTPCPSHLCGQGQGTPTILLLRSCFLLFLFVVLTLPSLPFPSLVASYIL